MFNREHDDEDWDKNKKEEIENRLSWRKTMNKLKIAGVVALVIFGSLLIVWVISKCRNKNK